MHLVENLPEPQMCASRTEPKVPLWKSTLKAEPSLSIMALPTRSLGSGAGYGASPRGVTGEAAEADALDREGPGRRG